MENRQILLTGASEAPRDRDMGLDFAKGVLIALVIIGHLLQFIIYRDSDDFWYSPCFKAIYLFHMPLFMGVSGYLSASAIVRKSFTRSVWDRSVQLLLPMLIWCAVMEGVKLAVFSAPTNLSSAALDFIKEFVRTYWFIWATFISFVLVKFISLSGRCSFLLTLISILVLILAPVTSSIAPLVRYTYPFFCIGYFLASSEKWKALLSYPILVKLMLSFSTSASFLAWTKETYSYNNLVFVHDANSAKQVVLMFFGSSVASALAVLILLGLWDRRPPSTVTRAIAVELGQNTLVLYLVQGAIFRLMALMQFGANWGFSTKIAVAMMLALAILGVATAVRRIASSSRYISYAVLGSPPAVPSRFMATRSPVRGS